MKPGGFAMLVAAAVLFVGGTFFGLRLLTSEAQVTTSLPTCETRSVTAGEALTANLVAVDVYNASRTAGLADRVSRLLQQRNFLPGVIANNPTELETSNVLIVGEDPEDPRVRLVGAQFRGDVEFEQGTVPGSDGVAVLVGSGYADRSLKNEAPSEVESDRELTACVPIAPAA